MRSFLPFAIAAVAIALPTPPVLAATYRVGSGAGCTHATIQAAIDTAVATAADDEIRISTTSWTGQALSINAAQGAVTLRGGYPNCTFSTPVAGARALLSGNNVDPVLRINASPGVTVRSLDLQGGRSADNGGGIRYTAVAAATFVIEDTYVRNNRAVSGGGISIDNGNAQLPPAQVSVDIRGASSVTGNAATGSGASMGGGIRCTRASVKISGSTHVSQNQADAHGGGIYSDDCRFAIGSTGVAGAVLWANQADGFGGGAFLRGNQASIDLFTVDPWQPARIFDNHAWHGGGLGISFGASVRLFDVNIEENASEFYASTVHVQDGSSEGGQLSSFLMQGGVEGAPAGAVACADPEACNRIVGNRTEFSGEAIVISGDDQGTLAASATLRGTRIEGNVSMGELFELTGGTLVLDGALITGNTFRTLLNSAEGKVTVVASTIAGNTFGSPTYPILYGRGRCEDAQPGLRIERSIIWQPGQQGFGEFDADFPVQPDCFRHLIAANFGGLPASPERVSVDPLFVDPGAGNYRPAPGSPALDFAPANAADATRDRTPRVLDLVDAPNRFGPQDLGAYERITDRIFAHGFECELCKR